MKERLYHIEFWDSDVREYTAEYDNIRDGVILLFKTKDKMTAYGIAVAGDKPENVVTLPLHNIKEITSKEIENGETNLDPASTSTVDATTTG